LIERLLTKPAVLRDRVRNHRAFLLPINRLDRGVDIQHPRSIQQSPSTLPQMFIQPRNTEIGIHCAKRSAQSIFADNPIHLQQFRIDPIASNRRHMRITSMARQNRKQPGAQYVLGRRGVRTRVTQRALVFPALPETRQAQKLNKERKLPHRRRCTIVIPAHIDPAPHGLQPNARLKVLLRPQPPQSRLTHWVTPLIPRKPACCLRSRTIAHRQLRFLGSCD
jgi:hypothetical protein